MTKKDFDLIAEVIARTAHKYDGEDWTIHGASWVFAREFADILGGTNPRFNRELFLERCGA